MNAIQIPQKTMSLKEITDLLNVRHDAALKKVKKMAESEGFGTMLEIDIVYNGKGQKLKTLMLDKRQSIAVASMLNTTLLMRIIDRWQELEQQSVSLPRSFSEALQLAADQAKQLEEAAPKLQVYEALAERTQDVATTALAKQLGISAIKLNRFLKIEGIKCQYRDYPAARYAEWFNVVPVTKNGHEGSQCLITPKGQIEITKRYKKYD